MSRRVRRRTPSAGLIAQLFAIEADIRGRSPAQRRDARQTYSLPILAELKQFLDTTLAKISGKSSLAQAIRLHNLTLDRLDALHRRMAGLEMTNNAPSAL